MSSDRWTAVDSYFADELLGSDEVLEATLRANAAAGLPAIDVSPLQGRLLQLLVRMSGARRVLEIGTLGGYSSICMARALPPDGYLLTLEAEPRHAETARDNIARAGLKAKVEVRQGRALDTLRALDAERCAPFDLIFIDADKPGNPDYLQWSLKLARTGTVIVVDNVVRAGEVADAESASPAVVGSRAAIEFIGRHPRLTASALQTVGVKGYDGFAIATVD